MEIFFTILIMTPWSRCPGWSLVSCPFRSRFRYANRHRCATGVADVWFACGVDPELFLVLFIPPLLFADGWKRRPVNFSNMGERFSASRWRGGGHRGRHWLPYLLGGAGHSLIPAFALAAVLSPTDAVALSGLLARGASRKKSWAFCRAKVDE